jgi:hypothetical protein
VKVLELSKMDKIHGRVVAAVNRGCARDLSTEYRVLNVLVMCFLILNSRLRATCAEYRRKWIFG